MDDIERKLRDLGERTAEESRHGEIPRRRIVRRARVRRGLTVVAPTAAVILLAAVVYPGLTGGPRRSSTELAPVDLAAAAKATEDAGSARIGMDMEMRYDGRTVTMNVTGRTEFDSGLSYYRYEQDFGPEAVEEVEVIIDSEASYVRPLGDAQWTKSELPSGGAGFFGGDPNESLGYLESVSEEVTNLGPEVRNGIEVTHLRAVLDESKLPDTSAAAGTSFEPLDVWVDAQNRVREIRSETSFQDGAGGAGGEVRFTMLLFDFGVAVDLEAPAPEDVTEEPPTPRLGRIGTSPGSSTLTSVTGRSGMSEPYVIVSRSDAPAEEVCVHLAGGRAARAVVVDEQSGEPVAVVPARAFGSAADGTDVDAGCATGPLDHAAVDSLISDPSRYTLRVRKESGALVVRLSDSGFLGSHATGGKIVIEEPGKE